MTSRIAIFLLVLCSAASAAQAAWLGPEWSHRIRLTADAAALDAGTTLTDFPLVADGSVLGPVFARALSDGSDVVVTERDGVTLLARELVEYDPQSATAELWFRADSLSTGVRDFYVYYGRSTPADAPGSVWAADYVAVYHFAENPGLGVLKDWTAAGNDARADQGVSNWTAGDVAPGQLGQGWHFNGSSHFINTDRIRTQDGGYTISTWLQHETRGTDFTFQSNPGYWHVSSQASNATNNVQFEDSVVDVRWGPNPIALGEFHHFAWVFRPAQQIVEFYYDGVARTPITFWPPETNPSAYYVGYPLNPDGTDLVGILGPIYFNSLDLMNGVGDEFRVSDDEKSAAWIATGFANQSDPSAFFSVSPEEPSTPVDPTNMSRLKGRW